MEAPPLYKQVPPGALWVEAAEERLQAFAAEALENPHRLRELFMGCWYEGYAMAVVILQMKVVESDRPDFVEKMRSHFIEVLGDYLCLESIEQ